MRDYDWQIIVTLHRTHNITKTAELMYMSQPTLTKHIQVIEEELGVPIIIRSRKGSEFTPEGEIVAEKAEQITALINSVKEELAGSGRGSRGMLKIGVPYSYARYVMPALLEKFAAVQPDAGISVVTGRSDELIKLVEDESLDMCFARCNTEESFLARIQVSEDPICAVYDKPFTVDDLHDVPFISYELSPTVLNAIQRWQDEHFPERVSNSYKVSTADMCVEMVRHGLGYSIFTDPRYYRNCGDIYSVPLEYADGTRMLRKTWLLYKKRSESNYLVSSFIKLVRNNPVA